jgi:hypothetical protein
MSEEHYEGEEEEDTMDMLDRFEQSLDTLTSILSQLLKSKRKETLSTNTCHEGPKKEEICKRQSIRLIQKWESETTTRHGYLFVQRSRWTSSCILGKWMLSS